MLGLGVIAQDELAGHSGAKAGRPIHPSVSESISRVGPVGSYSFRTGLFRLALVLQP